MKHKRLVLAVLVAALLLAVALRWRTSEQAEHAAPRAALRETGDATPSNMLPPNAVARAAEIEAGQRPPESGTPVATRTPPAAAPATDWHLDLACDFDERPANPSGLNGLSAEELAAHQAAQKRVLGRLQQRCAAYLSAAAELEIQRTARLHQAAQAGDPVAQLIETALSADGQDPKAHAAVLAAFQRALDSPDPARWQALTEAQAHLNGAIDERASVRPEGARSELIWTLIGCDLGMDCGADSPALDRLCVSFDACAYPNVESAILDALWANGDVQRYQRARAEILARIRSGQTAGIFDPPAPGGG